MINNYNRHIYEKRILKELSDIFLQYNNAQIEYSENKKININVKINSYIINFELEYTYPFSVPNIAIDNIFIFDFYKLPTIRMNNIFYGKNITNINCFQCSSHVNKKNWSPCRRFNDIIKEIKNIINIKKKIYFYIIIEKIKNKYLISDIDVFQYLFI